MASRSGRKQKREFRKLSGFDQLAASTEPADDDSTADEESQYQAARTTVLHNDGRSKSGETVCRVEARHSTDPEMADSEPADDPPPRRRGRMWLPLGMLGVVIVFVGLIPYIVSLPPVLNWIVAAATSRIDGRLTVESASLGWLSPPAVTGFALSDADGQPVLSVPQAETDRSLISLLFDWHNLGTIRLESPKANLVFRDDGSNLEDVLSSLIQPTDESKQTADVGLRLEVTDATVSITYPRTQKSWQIDQLQIVLDMPNGVLKDKPLEVKASGTLANNELPGKFAAGLTVGVQESGDRDQGSGDVQTAAPQDSSPGSQLTADSALRVENLPLEIFAPLIERFAPGTLSRLEGRLSTSIRGRFVAGSTFETVDSLSVEGTAGVDSLRVAAPALGSDELALSRLQTGCRVGYSNGTLSVDTLAAQTDVAAVSLSGTAELADLSFSDLAAAASKTAFDIKGHVDLAGLAHLLPATLRIREGTEIVSGDIQLAASSHPQPGGDRIDWSGRLQASDLVAVAGGRRFQWQQPIRLTLAAYLNGEGPFVESLKCESDFLAIDASGTPDKMNAQGSFDLGRLAEELSRFVDFGGLRLAGDGQARLVWTHTKDDRFQTQGELRLKDFQFVVADRRPWLEPNLTALFSAAGQTDFAANHRLDTATLEVTAGTSPPDVVRADLREPVSDFGPSGVWPVTVRCQGQLARLLPRVSPWVDLDAWQLAGNYVLTAQATGSTTAFAANQVRLVLGDLVLQNDGLRIAEPQAELLAAGSWDMSAHRLTVSSASVATASLSARASDVAAVFDVESNQPTELAGKIECQADLQRLAGWIVDPAAPPPWQLQGRLNGTAQLGQASGRIAASLQAGIDDLVVTHQDGHRFEEKNIRLTGRGSYDPTARLFVLEEASMAGGPVAVAAAGQIDSSSEPARLQVDGQIETDLEKLSELARSYISEGISLAGRSISPTSVSGPLALDQLQGSTRFGWTRGEVYGFQLSQGELQAGLADGLLQLKPAALDVSEGQLHVAAQVDVAADVPTLTVPAGPLVDNVRINPRMCAHGLQYIAPVLAGVATAEGRFSIEMEGCRIPLADPKAGELAGRMVIHSAQIGPGPLVRELALALGYKSPAQFANNSTIDFRMVDRRIYHRGVVVQFPDLAVRTYGSVGLDDKSLRLMAEMPVPPKWLGKDPVVNKALKDQIVQLPIGGTLEQPKVDQKTLRETSAKFLQKAAANVIEDQLIRGLDRLLK